ncbi:hypothetical protein ADK60_08880 [Streptomyces sp. XY431]|uniref:type I polyketide synthase n=1 Tax=Streptomyces sp. XY431 TaxID=1415562 RepID=UPI0006AFDAB6|nr:type I polyketide synthase [Streptomyces sp. XY431]KOV35570.1 hypothetical protein ADK60_08880 [Streptomyces sp. XY431]
MTHEDDRIAVIGVAGRFPGAPDVETYWSNVLSGRVSVSDLSDDTLRAAGVPESAVADPHYVKRAPLLDRVADFDAGLFGFSPREAELRDPQQRVFLEVAYSALEDAGVDLRGGDSIGVFGGGATNRYAELNVRRNARATRTYGEIGIQAGNHNDYIATIVSYKLDLRGPALTVATACSTSLVAIHLACQALRNGDCDVAVAGGVQLELPHGGGYRWVQGGIFSRDGVCRPFDSAADGTIFGDGAGAVVLKPLADALRDDDRILAVVRGSAINNDGSRKAGFAAPSVDGQFGAVHEALAVSGVEVSEVGYLEAHGTGTALGDPLEVEALTRAYRRFTDRTGFCRLSSVKGNVGHLGPASGIAGFIKAVLAVDRGVMPGTANFTAPNELIDLSASPFTLSARTEPWAPGPRIAGVSSFGIGGTNAHVVIEQAPQRVRGRDEAPGAVVLPLAAASAASVRAMAERLADHLAGTGSALPDVARALHRRPLDHPHRLVVTGDDADTLAEALSELARRGSEPVGEAPDVVFVLPGEGAQHPAMASGLHAGEPVFREAFDHCLELFGPVLDKELRELLLHGGPQAAERLGESRYAQPALFAVQWALGRLWESWGVTPDAVLGHGVGEVAAAALAGVLDLADAARLVVRRAELVAASPAGGLLGVPLPQAEAAALAEEHGVWVAAEDGPRACVLAGPAEALAEVRALLEAQGRRVGVPAADRACHTPLMAAAAEELTALAAESDPRPPVVRWFSGLTGAAVTDAQAVDPAHWGRQLSGRVRFREAVEAAGADRACVFVELGPGQSLAPAIRRAAARAPQDWSVAVSLPSQATADASAVLCAAATGLWQQGVPVRWRAVSGQHPRIPAAVPGYVFDRSSFWIDPDPVEPVAAPGTDTAAAGPARPAAGTDAEAPVDDRITVPGWRERPLDGSADASVDTAGRHWLLLGDTEERCAGFAERLLGDAATVTSVVVGAADSERALARVAEELRAHEGPLEIVQLCLLGGRPDGLDDGAAAEHWLDRGYRALLDTVRELARSGRPGRPVRLTVLGDRIRDVSGTEAVEPAKAAAVPLLQIAAQESERLRTRVIDAGPGTADGGDGPSARTLRAVLAEDRGARWEQLAVRGTRVWTPDYRPVEPAALAAEPEVADGDVWLVTGGLGALGLIAAERLAALGRVRLALLGRRGLPAREHWHSGTGLTADQLAAVAAITRIEATGATVLPLAGDVADRDALAAAVARARAELGPVRGVVHAAGVTGGGMIAVKDRATSERVLAPKVRGTLLLDELLGDEPEFFMLFSSVAALSGQFGLADYGAANAFLDSFAHDRARRRPGRTVSVNWPSWDGAGMAADSSAQASRHDPRWRSDAGVGITARPDGPEGAFEVVLTPEAWLLDEHRLNGVPMLPGTGYLELVLRAARTLHPGPLRLSDVTFTAPLPVDGPVRLALTLEPDGAGRRFRVTSEHGGRTVQHAGGTVTPVAEEMPVHDLGRLRAEHPEPRPLPEYNDGSGLMTVGPRWHNLRRIAAGGETVLAELSLPVAHAADVATEQLHAALLDCATSFALPLPEGVNALPFAYREIVVREALPATVTALVTPHADAARGTLVRDLALLDEAGREVVTVRGFTLRVIDRAMAAQAVERLRRTGGDAGGEGAEGTPGTPSAVPVLPAVPADPERAGVEDSVLDPVLGARLFTGLLARDLGPQVVIAPEGLRRKLDRVRAFTQASLRGGREAAVAEPLVEAVAVPAAVGAVVPVGGPVAELWAEVLGAAGGPEEDFFDAGGDSLAAIQLVDRIRDELGVELPISAMFDHPTLGELQRTVAEALHG